MAFPRVPMDLGAYESRVRDGDCFICALVVGAPGSGHEIVYDDGESLAFLSRYPTLYGYTLVAPRAHVELIHRDLDREAYLRLQDVVFRVAKAIESVVPCERMYVLSLGSQQGNRHVHWHVAPLPPGTPYEQQQYRALMAEGGIIPWTAHQAAELGAKLRRAIDSQQWPTVHIG
jgi:diadenosine tetraphosphate (Ap4A) HIT family hydrolase